MLRMPYANVNTMRLILRDCFRAEETGYCYWASSSADLLLDSIFLVLRYVAAPAASSARAPPMVFAAVAIAFGKGWQGMPSR